MCVCVCVSLTPSSTYRDFYLEDYIHRVTSDTTLQIFSECKDVIVIGLWHTTTITSIWRGMRCKTSQHMQIQKRAAYWKKRQCKCFQGNVQIKITSSMWWRALQQVTTHANTVLSRSAPHHWTIATFITFLGPLETFALLFLQFVQWLFAAHVSS